MRDRARGVTLPLLAAALLLCAAHIVQAVEWVVLVDNTGTMRRQSRGAATIGGIREFVSLTEQGDLISVVSYGETSELALPGCPVRIVGESSRGRVRGETQFSFTADRTDITDGMEYVWSNRADLFPGLAAGDSRVDAVVVLLTDGKLIPVYDDYAHYEETYRASRKRLLDLAGLFSEEGIRVCTITLGREEKVDGELMADVAQLAGGTHRHVEVAADVVDAYREIALEQAPQPSRERELAAERLVGERNGNAERWSGFGMQDVASAAEPSARVPEEGEIAERARVSSAGAIAAFPSDFCLGSAGVIAIFIGVIAVGTEKRQRWATRFSTALFGTGHRRVRGYLKPFDAPGTDSARANIGLENPGVESIRVGSGTPFISHVEATVEFVGTTDGTAPELLVERGTVTVEGEAVTTRKLKDGDIVEIDGMAYQYLRGNRR
jgi:Mg-chelatase subunit ChlD